jgi:uridylate kinase
MTAITFCKDNKLPLRVFDIMKDGNLERALAGDPVGTLVK